MKNNDRMLIETTHEIHVPTCNGEVKISLISNGDGSD